jgi:hypothetical protein
MSTNGVDIMVTNAAALAHSMFLFRLFYLARFTSLGDVFFKLLRPPTTFPRCSIVGVHFFVPWQFLTPNQSCEQPQSHDKPTPAHSLIRVTTGNDTPQPS